MKAVCITLEFFCLLLLAASKNLKLFQLSSSQVSVPLSYLGAESDCFMYRNAETTRITSNALRCEFVCFPPKSVYLNSEVGDSQSPIEESKFS